MQSFVTKIKKTKDPITRTDNILDYTANHMNICNYALPLYQSEIQRFLDIHIPKHILFDTIAVRDEQ